MTKLTLFLAACFAVGAASAAERTIPASSDVNQVTSTYSVGSVTYGTVKFSLTLSLDYPLNLTPTSYISQAQLATDVTSSYKDYPSPQDPPEAIFSSVITALLKKYPQVAMGLLMATATSLDVSKGEMAMASIQALACNTADGATATAVRKTVR